MPAATRRTRGWRIARRDLSGGSDSWRRGGRYNYGVNCSDDWFVFNPQGSVAMRLCEDATQNPVSNVSSGTGEERPYAFDESTYSSSGSIAPATILGSDAAGFEAQYGYQTVTATGLALAGSILLCG